MPDVNRPHQVKGLTAGEPERVRRELHASLALALARPDSLACGPVLAHLSTIDAELAERGGQNWAGEVTP